MRDYLKEFSGDVIGDFLVDNDIIFSLNKASGTEGTNIPYFNSGSSYTIKRFCVSYIAN